MPRDYGVSENSPTLFYSTKKPHLPRCIRLHSTKECGAHAPCIRRFLANIPAFLTSQIHPMDILAKAPPATLST